MNEGESAGCRNMTESASGSGAVTSDGILPQFLARRGRAFKSLYKSCLADWLKNPTTRGVSSWLSFCKSIDMKICTLFILTSARKLNWPRIGKTIFYRFCNAVKSKAVQKSRERRGRGTRQKDVFFCFFFVW